MAESMHVFLKLYSLHSIASASCSEPHGVEH